MGGGLGGEGVWAGGQRGDIMAAVCARLCGQHGKLLDTTFAISYLSGFLFLFLFPPPLTIWS